MRLDLDVHLDVPAAGGRRAALEDAIRHAIRSGRLASGSAVPSTRSLAADLRLSRSTVVSAYEQLAAEGYLIAEQGSATRVASFLAEPDEEPEADLLGTTPLHDFRPGEPDPSSFPRTRWLRSIRNVLDDEPDSILGYPDPRGVPRLRTVLAEHLARTRSAVASAAAMRIVGGFGAGVSFVAETLRHRGVERIAVEDPMLPFHADLLRLAGLDVVRVPLDSDGIDVSRLAAERVGAVLVTPAHQYPTGVTMSAQRRRDLVDWARQRDAWIIEDDYDGEFRYDRRPIGALQGLAPDRVVYAGTASKSLAPALRMGWLVVPEGLRRDLLRVMHVRAGASAIDQLALADFITRGELDRHVRQMRGRYERRSADLRRMLGDVAPWLSLGGADAGLQVMALIDDAGVDEAQLITTAERASVGLSGLQTHHRSSAAGPGLAIGFSRPPEHHFRTALEQLEIVLGICTPSPTAVR